MTIRYHERTKHRPTRYARSSGFLDWETEPDPFRRYEGAAQKQLILSAADAEAPYEELYAEQTKEPLPVTLSSISSFLRLSLGLSAWKAYGGSRWALRMNPSSGNLHPTEAYLLLPSLTDDPGGGVFHYNPYLHSLEQRAVFDRPLRERLEGHFGSEGFFVGLSSIFWREAWKYGERAFRYCCLDAGHALACLSFSARLQGWRTVYLNALSESGMKALLGFSQTRWTEGEEEHPDLILFVAPRAGREIPRDIPDDIIREFKNLSFQGEPNSLSKEHVSWKAIDDVSLLTEKTRTSEAIYHYGDRKSLKKSYTSLKAAGVIRQRRSGQAYDGRTGMEKEPFLTLLDRTLPRNTCPPFELELAAVSVHLLLFVHKVKDLDQGLYILIRNEEDLDDLKARLRPSFLWKKAADSLPLYLLAEGDLRRDAAMLSCGQEIAGDSAFAVAMIAKFREWIEKEAHAYRTLHWEAGMIGQILYLEAEAQGLRGTGIGCFFDDLVHESLGLGDNTYQDIYHFTLGGAVEDKRLTTLPPYHHLRERGRNEGP